MQTHMNNTKANQLFQDYLGKTSYANHQYTLHSGKIKSLVDNRRKSQVKIVNNNKKQLNANPMHHVNLLFKNIIKQNYKSTIDNKTPACYENGKKILKNRIKNNPHEKFIQSEHQKQLRSQQNRVKNCKSYTQRKKDNTDPIANPAHFIRQDYNAQSVTIQGYKDKVLKKNRPQSAVPQNKNPSRKQIELTIHKSSKQNHYNEQNMPTYSNFNSIQSYTKTNIKPKSAGYTRDKAQQKFSDLPQCTFKSILDYIVNNKMYKEADIKVLYVRLCHKYGDEKVDQIWEPLMDELES